MRWPWSKPPRSWSRAKYAPPRPRAHEPPRRGVPRRADRRADRASPTASPTPPWGQEYFYTMPSINRRAMLTSTAAAAVTVVVSQTRLRELDAAAPGCVLTGALEEGPFFVDERLERSDLRSDPVTGVISAGGAVGL